MNDTRPKLLKLLTDLQLGKIMVEYRDRLTRFGFLDLHRAAFCHLDWTFDLEKNDFEYVCNKMTPEEWKQYLE